MPITSFWYGWWYILVDAGDRLHIILQLYCVYVCVRVCARAHDECAAGFMNLYGMGQTSITLPTGVLRSGNSSSYATFPVKRISTSRMFVLMMTLSSPSSSCCFMSLSMWRPWLAATYNHHCMLPHPLLINSSVNVFGHTHC